MQGEIMINVEKCGGSNLFHLDGEIMILIVVESQLFWKQTKKLDTPNKICSFLLDNIHSE